MNDRAFIGVAKSAAYAVLWLAATVTLFRGVVGPLWGSRSDFGLVGAVGAGALGLIGLAWLAGVLFRDAAKSFSPEQPKRKK